MSEGGGGGEIDWSAVKRAYEMPGESVASIRRRFGLTVWQLRWRREKEGWATRPPVVTMAPSPDTGPGGARGAGAEIERIVSLGAAMIGRRVAAEGMTEANARTLGELCRARESLMRSRKREEGGKPRGKHARDDRAERSEPGGLAGAEREADLAWKRAELTRRFNALRRSRGLPELN